MPNSGNKFAVYKWSLAIGVLLVTLLGCSLVMTTPLPTEINAAAVETSVAVIQPVEQPVIVAENGTAPARLT